MYVCDMDMEMIFIIDQLNKRIIRQSIHTWLKLQSAIQTL